MQEPSLPGPVRSATWFTRNTERCARELLGDYLVGPRVEGVRVIGRIVETEAYVQDDPAFAGWNSLEAGSGRLLVNRRTEALFGPPGRAYVYRVYAHWLLNVVTLAEGRAGAVLVRAVHVTQGEALACRLRGKVLASERLAKGPGNLTRAFGIDSNVHLADLQGPVLFLCQGEHIPEEQVVQTNRIGLTHGADVVRRYYIRDEPAVSRQ